MMFLLPQWEACTDQIILAFTLECVYREMRANNILHIKDIILIILQEK